MRVLRNSTKNGIYLWHIYCGIDDMMNSVKEVALMVEINPFAYIRLMGLLETPGVIRLVQNPLNSLLYKNAACRLEMPGVRPRRCTVSGLSKNDSEEKVFLEFKSI